MGGKYVVAENWWLGSSGPDSFYCRNHYSLQEYRACDSITQVE